MQQHIFSVSVYTCTCMQKNVMLWNKLWLVFILAMLKHLDL